jgi:hypothetical protein
LRWPLRKTLALIEQHKPSDVQESVQLGVMSPIAAAPFIKPWLIACLTDEADEDYQYSAGTPSQKGHKLKWAAEFRRINMEDIEGMIDGIKQRW